ncbi:ABC transporter permease [Sporomusa sp.]|uniref:ABC transporter permease n=1 Tax=Sporomusa sp. TaxID=2078658 RepID=UPI002BBA07B2|nr:ABC transporter permease [Sporomusa sp.]HWR07735.1 ABC transporter permease [Sporomusa sp.]
MQRKIMLMSPALFMLIAFGVVPLFIMLYFSFLSNGPNGSFTLQNYTDFFSKELYLKLTAKTVQLSLIVTLLCLIVAYPMAYIMAKIIRKGKGLLLLLIIIPFWTSALVRAYSWVNLLRDGGMLEILLRNLNLIEGSLGILFTQAAVIIGLVHIYFPYMVITIFMSLEKLDDAILDAAQSLGATPFTTFRRITLPLSKVGILTGSVLVFIPCLGSFVEPRILGGVNGSVIGTIIEDQFFEIYGWNFGAAIAFILLAMVLASMGLVGKFNKEV